MSNKDSTIRIKKYPAPELIRFGIDFLSLDYLKQIISDLYGFRNELDICESIESDSFEIVVSIKDMFSLKRLQGEAGVKSLKKGIFMAAGYYRLRDPEFFNQQMAEIKSIKTVKYLIENGFIDEAEAYQKTAFTIMDFTNYELQEFSKKRASEKKDLSIQIAC